MLFEEFGKLLDSIDLERKDVARIRGEFLENAEKIFDQNEGKTGLQSAWIYVALKELNEEERYDAVTINCLSGILDLIETAPCLVFKKLRDEGIPTGCEADIPQIVAILLLRYIAEN